MGRHLHKKLSDEEVKTILVDCVNKDHDLDQTMMILQISRRQFFDILKKYKQDPERFSLQYQRKKASNKISDEYVHIDISEPI